MNALFFMFVLSSGLLLCRLSWSAYRYVLDDLDEFPIHCDCLCADSTMHNSDLKATVHYRGPKDKGSCSCQDFLLPKLKHYLFSVNGNVTCEICKCKNAKISQCAPKGFVSFIEAYDIMLATIFVITFVFVLNAAILNMRRSRSNFIRRYHSVYEQKEKQIKLLEDFLKDSGIKKSGLIAKKNGENDNIVLVNKPKCDNSNEPQVHKKYNTFSSE